MHLCSGRFMHFPKYFLSQMLFLFRRALVVWIHFQSLPLQCSFIPHFATWDCYRGRSEPLINSLNIKPPLRVLENLSKYKGPLSSPALWSQLDQNKNDGLQDKQSHGEEFQKIFLWEFTTPRHTLKYLLNLLVFSKLLLIFIALCRFLARLRTLRTQSQSPGDALLFSAVYKFTVSSSTVACYSLLAEFPLQNAPHFLKAFCLFLRTICFTATAPPTGLWGVFKPCSPGYVVFKNYHIFQ